MTTGPRVAKTVKKTVTSTVRYEFSHAELCKRLRIPESAAITVMVADKNGSGEFPIQGLTAEVTTEATK